MFSNAVRFSWQTVGVSSVTGDGMDNFLQAVQEARQEYLTDYRPDLERLARDRDEKRERSKKEQLARLMRDMKVGGSANGNDANVTSSTSRNRKDMQAPVSVPLDETYEGDGQIIEPVSV